MVWSSKKHLRGQPYKETTAPFYGWRSKSWGQCLTSPTMKKSEKQLKFAANLEGRITTQVKKCGDAYYVYEVTVDRSKDEYHRVKKLVAAFHRKDLAEDFAREYLE